LAAVLVLLSLPVVGAAQQVVQRGAPGRPAQMLDETAQWTTPISVTHDSDVEIYIPDVSNQEWLEKNYPDFWNKHQYEMTFLTFYQTPRACKANMIQWGNSDAASLNACEIDIGYRLHRVSVDTHLKTVTVIEAAMVDRGGNIVPGTTERQPISRTWTSLGETTQQALEKATDLVKQQMEIYDRRVNRVH
jgi:hypothetical protein